MLLWTYVRVCLPFLPARTNEKFFGKKTAAVIVNDDGSFRFHASSSNNNNNNTATRDSRLFKPLLSFNARSRCRTMTEYGFLWHAFLKISLFSRGRVSRTCVMYVLRIVCFINNTRLASSARKNKVSRIFRRTTTVTVSRLVFSIVARSRFIPRDFQQHCFCVADNFVLKSTKHFCRTRPASQFCGGQKARASNNLADRPYRSVVGSRAVDLISYLTLWIFRRKLIYKVFDDN